MRPRQGAEIGAPSRDDGVDLVRRRDVADSDGRHPDFIADHLGKRRLEHAAIGTGFAQRESCRRYVNDVRSMAPEHRGDL